MQREPNAILHMTAYGAVYGFLLAMLVIWGIFIYNVGLETISIRIWEGIFFASSLAFGFGGLLGSVLGVLSGWILDRTMRDIDLHLSKSAFIEYRNRSMSIIGGMTMLSMGVVLLLIVGLPRIYGLQMGLFLSIISSLIASGAAIYATHRFMLKLHPPDDDKSRIANKNHLKPAPIRHMTKYGFLSGFLLATIYLFVMDGMFILFDSPTLFGVALLGLIIGGIPGIIIGLIDGWILKQLTRDRTFLNSDHDFRNKRMNMMGICGMVALITMWILSIFIIGIIGEYIFFLTVFAGLVPSLLAAVAVVYAVRRYMLRLKAWDNTFEKAKNDAAASTKNKLTYDDNLKSDEHITPDEAQHAQIKQD